jgi:hypothetical protein
MLVGHLAGKARFQGSALVILHIARHHTGPLGQSLLHRTEPDAGGRTGDDDDFVGEALGHEVGSCGFRDDG